MKLDSIKKSYINGKLLKSDYIEEMFKVHRTLYEYCEFIKDTDIAKIEITDGSVVITNRDGIKILCRKEDKRLAPIDTLNFGSYEVDEINMSLSLIDDGGSIFDIGSNFGWYSIYFSKKFKKAKIFAFEPVAPTFEYLKFNIKLNGLHNIQPYNFGFSNKAGEETFYFRAEESVSASMANLKGDKKAQKVTCKMMLLDDFVKENKLKVDFIKCDVEGSELLVFEGAKKTISRYKPIIFCEMLRKWSAKFDYHPNKIVKLLKSLGYECFTIKNDSLKRFLKMTDDTIETNFFFLHLKKHKSKIKKLAL